MKFADEATRFPGTPKRLYGLDYLLLGAGGVSLPFPPLLLLNPGSELNPLPELVLSRILAALGLLVSE